MMTIISKILFLTITFSVFAEESLTMFIWQADQLKPFKGICYEVDKETGGQKYIIKVNSNNCKPESIKLHWNQNEGKPGGRCYEVDTETGGQKYAATSFPEKCRPQNLDHVYHTNESGKSTCYAIDIETGGTKYFVKAKKEKCKTMSTIHKWIPHKKNIYQGECYLLDTKTFGSHYKQKVSKSKCRPSETSFEWIQEDIHSKGNCFEVDKNQGPRGYSNNVLRKKCLGDKPKISYKWLKDSNKPYSGKCIEVIKDSLGQVMTKATKVNNCRPDKVQRTFILLRADRGKCIEIDTATLGENFSRRLPVEECRPQSNLLVNQWFEKTQGFKEGCYEIDKKTRGQEFINKIQDLKCISETKLKWVKDKTGWGGRCKSINLVGGREVLKGVNPSKCKPKNTLVVFHNLKEMDGRCYEIDAENGNEYYSLIIDRKKCRPKDVTYRFYKRKKDIDGKCYRVDKETQGETFNQRVGSKFCKDILFQENLKKSVEDFAPIEQGDLP
jgi:hypothetical protein